MDNNFNTNNNLYNNTTTYSYSTKKNIIQEKSYDFNIGKLKFLKTNNNSLLKTKVFKKTII
jgi:hypothetical protein